MACELVWADGFSKETRFLLSRGVVLLLGVKLGLLGGKQIKAVATSILRGVLSAAGEKLQHLEELVEALTGYPLSKCPPSPGDEQMAFEGRVKKLVDLFLGLFLPELKGVREILLRMAGLSFALLEKESLGEVGQVLLENMDSLGHIFGVRPQLLKGVVGILNGNYGALAEMAAPLANIDPEVISRFFEFLAKVKQLLRAFTRGSPASDENDEKESRLQSIKRKIHDGSATYREFFEAVDLEGDGNGAVCRSEFTLMLQRLHIRVSSHRITEIFAAVQATQAPTG